MLPVVIPEKIRICFNPSIAGVTEMGGVIIPSAKSAAPPIMAGKTSHFFLRRTKAYKLNIPPSPLLSAFSVRITYLIVVCKVSVHIMQEREPRIKRSVIASVSYNGIKYIHRRSAYVSINNSQSNKETACGYAVNLLAHYIFLTHLFKF